MSTPIDDGGPAFPHTRIYCESPNDLMHQYVPISGMSLRDWFAGQALPEQLRAGNTIKGANEHDVAKAAYAIADAMLIERNKAGTKPAN
jgi:hypothetical protein